MSIKGFNISGTTYKVDYPELDNLPQINGNDLVGDLNAEDLGLDQVYWAGYRWATNAEIEAALNDGKIVLCRVPNPLALLDPPVVCQLTQRNSATNHRFAAITTGAEILLYVAYCINNSWTSGVFKLATDASVPDPNPNPAAPLGTASAGSSNTYSRGDHVHAMPSAEDVGAIADPDTKASGQVLTYNGYSWVARTPSGGGLSQEAKSALMDCFAHVAWADANGQTYYNALASALGLHTLTSISAVYTQSGTVYDTDTLDSLKDDLVVTANYSDSSTQTVPAADYTLSGTLTEGTSTITVSYGGKTDTFDVTVSHGIDTTAEIDRSGYILVHIFDSYRDKEMINGAITIMYDLESPTTVLQPAGILPNKGVIVRDDASIVIYDGNGSPVNYVNEYNRWGQDADGALTEFTQSWNVSQYSKIAFSIDERYLDDSYMYHKPTGQVFFAGKNTPYYGMSNISEAVT